MRDVRRDLSLTQLADAVPGVITLVGAQGPRVEATFVRLVDQLGRHVSVGSAGRLGELEVDQPTVAIVHQRMTHERQCASLPLPFLANRVPPDRGWHSVILAGEEFVDQHHLFDAEGNVTEGGGKQVDPVDFSRADEPWRKEILAYISTLVHLRTTHTALSVNDCEFIHVDVDGKKVVVWNGASQVAIPL